MKANGLLRGRGSKGAETVRLSLTLERQQAEQIEAIAAEMKVSVAWVIRDALDGYLADDKRKRPTSGS